ncbi:MAG: hypothetical protein FRX49_00218 [Trebouxia sp. A1-2]|nr:MAG: hypothetical protein FRX49_00218 [Trebouxia sp. A1-2]
MPGDSGNAFLHWGDVLELPDNWAHGSPAAAAAAACLPLFFFLSAAPLVPPAGVAVDPAPDMLIHHLLSLASSFPGLLSLMIHLMLMLHAIVGAWTSIPSTLGPTPIAADVLALLQHRGDLVRQ